MATRKFESEKYMYSGRLTSKIAPKIPALVYIHLPVIQLSDNLDVAVKGFYRCNQDHTSADLVMGTGLTYYMSP